MKTLHFAPKAYCSSTPPTSFPRICKRHKIQSLVKNQQTWEPPLTVISTRELLSLTDVLLLATSTSKLNPTVIHWKGLQVGNNSACFHQSSHGLPQGPQECVSLIVTDSEITIIVLGLMSTQKNQGDFLRRPNQISLLAWAQTVTQSLDLWVQPYTLACAWIPKQSAFPTLELGMRPVFL